MGEMTYSFVPKKYLPREYPVANLVLSYRDDVIAPSDFHLPTDKDNVFLAWKWTNVDHMMYNRNLKLHFDREWANGFRLKAQVQHARNDPTSALV